MAHVVLLVLFPLLMILAASSDLFTMTIPNRLALALVVGFVAMAVLSQMGWQAVLMHVAAGTLVLMVAFGLFARGWIGGGDAKLAAGVALWFGFDLLPEYLVISAVAGGALTFALLAMRQVPLPAFAMGWDWLSRLHDRKTGVPYGIALAAAALALYPHSEIWQATVAL